MSRLPGLLLASGVAIAAVLIEPLLKSASGGRLALPAMVIALVIGIMLNGVAQRPAFGEGITYAVKTLLRYAIALLGVKIAFSDLVIMGGRTAILVVLAMAATIATGFALARLLKLDAGLGALAGAATAVCGASAALATATVVPEYRNRGADIAFSIVMANAASTLAMVGYPPLCAALGLSPQETGIMLGLTIHDMAQVVGAGYSLSESVGNAAVIVKLFRVVLLLPAVLVIGHYFARAAGSSSHARVPVPGFAVAFLALAIVNSLVGASMLAPYYAPVKEILSEASRWGLLLSIAALGLGTSLGTVLSTGWRHILVFSGTTAVILAVTLGGIVAMR
jgi:uncharacterized integral membrane protein (TIGR00698 family)